MKKGMNPSHPRSERPFTFRVDLGQRKPKGNDLSVNWILYISDYSKEGGSYCKGNMEGVLGKQCK